MVQYEKVLEVLKAADGEPVMLEELKEKCKEDQSTVQEEEDESKSNIWNRDRIH